MSKSGPATHLEVRGLFESTPIPACGAWDKRLTSDPSLVTCGDCKATFDFVMAGGKRDA